MKPLQVLIQRVMPDPEQPRKKFDDSYIEELAASIKANGLLQPISVRLVAPDPRVCFGSDALGDLALFLIVAGECRWRACKLAGLTEVPVLLREDDPAQVPILQIIENIQRRAMTPLEEARAYQRQLESGLTVEELASRLGIKQPWRITERTALLALRTEYQALLERGTITPSQATELARLDWPNQDALVRLIRDGKCTTYAKLRAASDALLQASKQTGFFEDPKVSEKELQELTAFERKVEQVVQLVSAGFTEGEVAILRKINPARASVVAAQLGIIETNLKQLGAELQKAIVRGAVHQEITV